MLETIHTKQVMSNGNEDTVDAAWKQGESLLRAAVDSSNLQQRSPWLSTEEKPKQKRATATK